MSRGLSIVGTKGSSLYMTDWEFDLINLAVKKSGFSRKVFLELLVQTNFQINKFYKVSGDTGDNEIKILLSDEEHSKYAKKVNNNNISRKGYILSLVQAYINNEFELTLEGKEIHTVDIEENRTRDKSVGMSLGEVERNLIRQQAENKGLSIVDYLVDLISNAELKKYIKEKNKYLRKYSLVIKVTEEEHDMIKEKAKFSELSMANYIMRLVEEDIHKK